MEQLTLSLEGVPVSHSLSQETAKDLKANQDSCSSIYEQFVMSCQLTLSGRTSRERCRAKRVELSSNCSTKWMTSGMGIHGVCWTRNSSEYPKDADVCFLSDVLETQDVPQKYFLSATACAGILRRAESRGKPLPMMLADALWWVILNALGKTYSTLTESDLDRFTSKQGERLSLPTRCSLDADVLGGKGALIQENVSSTLSTSKGALSANSGMKNTNYICVADDTAKAAIDENLCGSLKVYGSPPYVAYPQFVVRRLTPLECERLQGFPDGWTDIEVKGKPASDTARYKALGNSMAVPVMRWIGERIERIENEETTA